MRNALYVLVALLFFSSSVSYAQIITTIAGNGIAGTSGDGSPATAAEINYPVGIAVDGSGNVYIADWFCNRVRKINAAGIMSTFAGNGTTGFSGDGGAATLAELDQPMGVCVDAAGNVYIADNGSSRIRKVNPSGIISTFAGGGFYLGEGGPATAAFVYAPSSVFADGAGNVLVAVDGLETLRKINPSGIITTIAGGGTSTASGIPATNAQLNVVQGVTEDAAGNIYIASEGTSRVLKVDGSGTLTDYAGMLWTYGHSGDGGPATAAKINVAGVSIDASGNVYIADNNGYLREVNTSGIISSVAGNGTAIYSGDNGPASAAGVVPSAVALDGAGNIYIGDGNSHRIRKIWQHNYPPHFSGGHGLPFAVCENSAPDSANTLLAVIDTDAGQIETWSMVTAPLHGTAALACSRISTGGVVTPVGLSYTPGSGYSGKDTFKVRVTDGGASDTATVYVTVNPVAAISGPAMSGVCAGATASLSDVPGGGTWYSATTAVATISTGGVVTGTAPGTSTIVYTTPAGCKASATVTINPVATPITGPTSICAGATSALTDAGGGAWSSSNTTVVTVNSGGICSGVKAGSATITYTLPTGCIATTLVRVNAISRITGGTSVCAGSSIALTDSVGGGTWTAGSGNVSVGSATGIVSGISLGTATIVYTSVAGCSVSTTVTVSSGPTGIIGTPYVCKGATTALTDAVTGGTWTSSNTGVATIGLSGGVATGVNPGIASIVYSLGVGCTATQSLTVYALPSGLTGAGNVCEGSITALSSATAGGTWSSSNGAVATIAGGIVSGISADTATIIYSITATGCSTTKVISVNPLPAAISGAGSVCVGAGTRLSDASAGGTWKSGSGNASIGITTGLVTGAIAGSAPITYTLGTGCITTVTITVDPTASAITGRPKVCAGAITNLSDGGSGTWYSENTAVAGVGLYGAVTGIAQGTATITYALLTGCPATIVVTVNPLPAAITGSTNVCIGNAAILSDADRGGVWSRTGTGVLTLGTTSGIVTGLSSGVVTITYTLPTGCSDTEIFTVNPPPSAVNGAGIVCGSVSITLSDTTAGGTWLSSNTVVATVNALTGTVTGKTAGTANIWYQLTATGCESAKTVTVNPAASPITGVRDMCAGDTLTAYDADTPHGAWTSTLVTMSKSGLVSAYMTGTGTITYTLPTGCFSTVSLSVSPLPPPLTGSNEVCAGNTIMLTDTVAGGTWSSSSGSVAAVSGGTVSGVSKGASMISYSLPTGCVVTKTIAVYQSPSPITGTVNICVDAAANLSDALSGGSWSTSGGVAGVDPATGVVTGLSAGTAMITYTTTGICSVYKTVSVIALPAAYLVTGGGTLCVGDTGYAVRLGGSDVSVEYLLYHSGLVVDSMSGTGSLLNFGSWNAAGSYKIMAISSISGCSSFMTDSATNVVKPLVRPSVSIATTQPDTVCAGTPVTYTVMSVNGGTVPVYEWRVNGIVVGSGGSYSYTPVDGNVIVVSVTSSALCASPVFADTFVKMTVITPVAPVLTVTADPGTSISEGQSVTFTATVTNGVVVEGYQWLLNGIPITGAINATYTSAALTSRDTVSCSVTGITGGLCTAGTTKGVSMNVFPAGVASPTFPGNDIKVFPNPVTDALTITGITGRTNYSLSSVTGIVISEGVLQQGDNFLPMKQCVPGIYILEMTGADGIRTTVKVVKE